MSKRLNQLLAKRGVLSDQVAALLKKIDAIVDKAAKDGERDLSDLERKEFDGHKAGIDALKVDLARLDQDIADERSLDEARRASATPIGGGGSDREGAIEPGHRIIIPAQAKHRYGTLKAFKGPDAEENAYIAGMFLLATLGRGVPQFANLHSLGVKAAEWCKERGIDVYTRAQNEGSNTAGGYLVIPAMETAIIDLRETYGTFRRLVGVRPLASDTQTQPMRTGGLTAYWVDEAAQITESEKSWGQVTMIAKKLAAITRMSTELNEDAIISIADDLTREMAYAFAVSEDSAGWNGDGSSSYGGIIGVRTKIVTNLGAANQYYGAVDAASGHDTFAEYDKADLEKVEGLLPKYVTNPSWYCSQPFWVNVLRRIATAAGGVTATEMVNGVRKPSYMGYPVEIDQTLPRGSGDLSDTAIALFGDLSLACKMGERRGITISLSDQRYWEFDQIGVKATERVNIVTHSLGDVANATNPNAGPIVALIAE